MIYTESFFTFPDGRKIRYYDNETMNGNPIVLLHGAPGYLYFWNDLDGFPIDNQAYRFISVDRRGYGESDFKKGTTFLNYTEDIIYLLDHLSIKRTSLIGVSGGGPFALAFAYKHPLRTDTVAVISSAAPITVPEIESSLSKTNRIVFRIARSLPGLMKLNMRFLISMQKNDPVKYLEKMSYKLSKWDRIAIKNPTVQTVLTKTFKNSYINTWKGYANDILLQANDWEFDISKIQTKVKIFQALNDTSSPKEVGSYLESQIADSELFCYKNAGHLWHMENIVEVFKHL